MSKKTKQLLVYLTKNHISATVTSLMKLSYLVDLIHIRKEKGQIADFEYRRYKYGPFDHKIYSYLIELVKGNILYEESEYAPTGEEYIVYKFNEKNKDFNFDKLSEEEKATIDEVLASLSGYGAKTLTDITYKTAPMKALGATPGGDEDLNAVLDLTIK